MSKPPLPTEIHVLDLFCGSGTRLKMLAQRHTRRNFVGVDEARKMQGALPLPANLHFVKQDVVEFLRSRRQAGKIHQVNIDYGVHHISKERRRELFAHIAQLLPHGGSLHITTYTQHNAPGTRPEELKLEAEAAGLKLFKQAPFKLGTSHSNYSLLHGNESTRLWFKKPRKTRV